MTLFDCSGEDREDGVAAKQERPSADRSDDGWWGPFPEEPASPADHGNDIEESLLLVAVAVILSLLIYGMAVDF